MKKIFTLFAAVTAALSSFAQISENFNGGLTSLSATCWRYPASAAIAARATSATGVSGSSLQMPSTGTWDLSTPYLTINNSYTISFDYLIDNNLNGNATRTIQIGTINKAGVFTSVSPSISVSNPANRSNSVSRTITTIPNEPVRFTIRVIGVQGDGQCNVILDNVNVSSTSFYYGSQSCNTAPVAEGETFPVEGGKTVTTGSVLTNDADANREALTPVLVTPSPDGTITFLANGNFTFTPNPGFEGASTTFRYLVRDNGYDPRESNTVTATLIFVENATLPVKLESFTGAIQQGKAQLKWTIADNENAEQFEVQRSSNGVNFTTIGVVMAGDGAGRAAYKFADALPAGSNQYYRLKMWDNEKKFEYSNIVLLQTATTQTNQNLQLWQPAANQLALRFTATGTEKLQLVVVDLSGRVLLQQAQTITIGNNLVNIALNNNLKPGVYVVQLKNADVTYTGKLMVP